MCGKSYTSHDIFLITALQTNLRESYYEILVARIVQMASYVCAQLATRERCVTITMTTVSHIPVRTEGRVE